MASEELVLCIKSVGNPDDLGTTDLARKGKTYTLIRSQTCEKCQYKIIEVAEVQHDHELCDLGPNILPADHFVPINKPGSIDEREVKQLFLPGPRPKVPEKSLA